MKFFDAHTDILYDINAALVKGDENRFDTYHRPQLELGNVVGGVWTMYSPREFDLVPALKGVLNNFSELEDFNYEIILGLEGLLNVKDLEEFAEIYDLGFKHTMLTWNEANKYATGVGGPKDRGLTDAGREIIRYMESKDMILDLAHLNEQSFFDCLEFSQKNIIVSHTNMKNLRNHRRNLSIEQLKKLKEVNGLLGLTLAGAFIDEDENKRTVDRFIDHLDFAIEIMGIDNICFGFDFMDYFDSKVELNIREIPNAAYLAVLVTKLKQRGFGEAEIEKMAYSNFVDRYKTKFV